MADKPQRTPQRKRSSVLVEKQFAREYIANGMNGTQAMIKVKKTKDTRVAQVQASRMLSKDIVRKSIAELLPSDEVEASIIKEAFTVKRDSSISWKDLRGYTELSLKLKGHLGNDSNKPVVNVGIVIQ